MKTKEKIIKSIISTPASLEKIMMQAVVYKMVSRWNIRAVLHCREDVILPGVPGDNTKTSSPHLQVMLQVRHKQSNWNHMTTRASAT